MCNKLVCLVSLVLLLGPVGGASGAFGVAFIPYTTAASESVQGAISTVNNSGMTGDQRTLANQFSID